MLLRHEPNGTFAITQPRHAWLAGELARAWGGGGFFVPPPRDAVICAVALHDIGWIEWERSPQIDDDTGLPLTFDKVDATVHTRLWQAGVEAAGVYGALPALHVSRHGVAIYDLTFDRSTARPEQAAAVDKFIGRQMAFQADEIASLTRDTKAAAWVSEQHLELTRAFIVAVDTLSLQLCWGVQETARVQGVPHREGPLDLELKHRAADHISVDPWPFASERLVVEVEGKVIQPVSSQSALHTMWGAAKPIYRRVTLLPP